MSATRDRAVEVLREFANGEPVGEDGWVLFADKLEDIADALIDAGFIQLKDETNREHYFGDAADVWVDRP